MQRFRTKCLTVEAEQFLPPLFLCQESGLKVFHESISGIWCGMLQTKIGLYVVHVGEWIITEAGGKQYPLEPEKFNALFEQLGAIECGS